MGVRLKIGDAPNLYNFTIFFEVGYLQCFSQPSLNSVKLWLKSHRLRIFCHESDWRNSQKCEIHKPVPILMDGKEKLVGF